MNLEVSQTEIKMAKEIAVVRKTGATNMLDLDKVAEVLYNLGYETTAEFISRNRASYIKLVQVSSNY